MTLGEHFDYINFVVNRDQLGDPASPAQFNNFIKKFSIQYYNKEYQDLIKQVATGQRSLVELFYENGALKRFETKEQLNYTPPLPAFVTPDTSFKRALTLTKVDGDAADPVRREVKILGPMAFENKLASIFRYKLSESPVAREYPDKLQVVTMGTDFDIVYIRKVLEPYFDYCLDDGDQVLYMPVGSIINTSDELVIESVVVATGVSHPNNPSLPYTSTSVELDWDEDWQKNIIEDIIAVVSKRSREGEMVQMADIEKTEP